jgi:hypothetical protein
VLAQLRFASIAPLSTCPDATGNGDLRRSAVAKLAGDAEDFERSKQLAPRADVSQCSETAGNVVVFPLTRAFDSQRTFRGPPSPAERLEDYYCYLYRLRDGTPIYVGQGYGRRPWRKERRDPQVDALIASGEAVGPAIIASLETQKQAWTEEIRVIALYGRICDGGTLLNKTLGGPGSHGIKMSPEHKAKLRAASHTAESIAKAAAANRGRKHSDAARAKMQASHLGKKYGHHSDERKAAIRAGMIRAKLAREAADAPIEIVDLPMAA